MPINFDIIESICDKRNHGEYRIIKVRLAGIDIRFDEPLKRYTYTKVGGPADYLSFPRNRYELVRQ